MKKSIVILLLIFAVVKTYGQIQLVYTSPIARIGHFGVLHLYHAGNKFVERNNSLNNLTLYNSDFSIYKVIDFPPLPYSNPNSQYIHYITENLFDTDSTDLEYLIYYEDTSQIYHVRIYDEIGNLLFQRDSSVSYPHFGNSPIGIHPYSSEIDYVDSAFFLRIYTVTGTEIYRLPGVIPCFDPCSNSNLGLSTVINKNVSIPYYFLSDPVPNPATNSTEIRFLLPPNVDSGFINIFDQQGKQIKTIPVSSSLNSINISMSEFHIGLFYYNLTWDGNSSTTNKKLVIIR